MASDDSKQTNSDGAAQDGFWIDSANSKYRQFANRDGILEYTIEDAAITVDWISGRNAVLMIQRVLEFEGTRVRRVSGYVTDKLGALPDAVLRRAGSLLVRRLNQGWTARVDRIEGRRYLVLTR